MQTKNGLLLKLEVEEPGGCGERVRGRCADIAEACAGFWARRGKKPVDAGNFNAWFGDPNKKRPKRAKNQR